MKLYYYQSKSGNVGDDLNPWLWPRVLDRRLDADGDHLLIGIGSILNNRIPVAREYTVLGAGLAGQPPRLDVGRWDFVALRGPLSKAGVEVDSNIPLLDPAYLMVSEFPAGNRESCEEIGYIPHFRSIDIGAWESVCDYSGLKFIDPRWHVEKFLKALWKCDRVITEAMHGAILADAYGIPWLGVKAHGQVNSFKWSDWGQSLDLDFNLQLIPATWKGEGGLSITKRSKIELKRFAKFIGVFQDGWSPIESRRTKSSSEEIKETASLLRRISESSDFLLSDQRLREAKTEHLREAIVNWLRTRSE
ncbi:polysaccharide pyruvyl transferase family protein [Stieleria sp. JC731]|uniref:polysaccharide pyruvyl transferase family protein n=1 Tax=Pirellulaceae TaxID=2691357 RepID=UPI001E567B98|nr:polysaccharide pyruvyl transferase family protein [Stieleria sp. JC731]MCC9601447.1 polysaccharide pyruvyl transferase family protein [Stieleria sp. JC731]